MKKIFQNFLNGFRTQTSTTFDLLDHKLSENFGYIFFRIQMASFYLGMATFFLGMATLFLGWATFFLRIIFFQNGYILVPHRKVRYFLLNRFVN